MGKLVYESITEKIIGCAIEVHKCLGPGFLEKFYEDSLCIELNLQGLKFERQPQISLNYKGSNIGFCQLDLIVEKTVVVELKAIKQFDDIHFATVLSYLKASRLPVALLLNFNTPTLSIKRFGNSIFSLIAEARKYGDAEGLVKFLRNESKI